MFLCMSIAKLQSRRSSRLMICTPRAPRSHYSTGLAGYAPTAPLKISIKQQQTALNCNRVHEYPG
jgi:hypothetical protein